MRKPSFTSIPINELIKLDSRRMEGETKKDKYRENHVFQTSQNIGKTKKKEQIRE
jgi:hypothetical protein